MATNPTLNQRLALLGNEIREGFTSKSPDEKSEIISTIEKLLSDLRPSLLSHLKQLGKPLHRHPSVSPGPAPENTRWVCRLCPNPKNIFTKTSDLRIHLKKAHNCQKSELETVFSRQTQNQPWEHFGPCTEEQAKANGWAVRSYDKNKPNVFSSCVQTVITATSTATKAVKKRLSTGSESTSGSPSRDSAVQPELQASEFDTGMNGTTVVAQDETLSISQSFDWRPSPMYDSPQTMSTYDQEATYGQAHRDASLLGMDAGDHAFGNSYQFPEDIDVHMPQSPEAHADYQSRTGRDARPNPHSIAPDHVNHTIYTHPRNEDFCLCFTRPYDFGDEPLLGSY